MYLMDQQVTTVNLAARTPQSILWEATLAAVALFLGTQYILLFSCRKYALLRIGVLRTRLFFLEEVLTTDVAASPG